MSSFHNALLETTLATHIETEIKLHSLYRVLPIKMFYFRSFQTQILQKICSLQRDSNSDRRSRRQARWPFDHHHGPWISDVSYKIFLNRKRWYWCLKKSVSSKHLTFRKKWDTPELNGVVLWSPVQRPGYLRPLFGLFKHQSNLPTTWCKRERLTI